jgi:hypothetical protein
MIQAASQATSKHQNRRWLRCQGSCPEISTTAQLRSSLTNLGQLVGDIDAAGPSRRAHHKRIAYREC